MGKILNSLINCRGRKSTPLNFFKDFYFFFMLIWPITSFSMLLSGPEDFLIGSYATFVYFSVITFYWTPIFQEELDINSRSLNILMYLVQWVPFFGNLGLVVLKLSKRDKSSNSSDKLQKVELKRRKKSDKTVSKDSKASSEENLHEENNKVKVGDKQSSGLYSSKNKCSDYKSTTRGKEKESAQEKKELLDRLEIKLKNKGYSEKPLKDIFEKLDISEIEQAKIKTALHLTANNVDLRRILTKLNVEEYCEKNLNSLCKELEEERFFSKSKEPISFELESYNKSSNEECLNLIKEYHKRGRTEARILEKIGRRLTITGEDNACEVLEILNNSYTEIKNRKEKFDRDKIREERDKLRAVAEDAKDDNLDKIGQQLEKTLEIDLLKPNQDNSVKNNSVSADDRENTENQGEPEDKDERLDQKSANNNYVEKINSFHDQGSYRYRLLERIGRRLLNQGASAEEVYSLISEFSESERFRKMSIGNLEQVATEANEKSFSSIEDKLS